MIQTNTPVLTRTIYIIGGVLIVCAAVKCVWSGCKFLMDYFQNDAEE